MASDKKPVYIPRQKRLHGAFRGGFSAGYFNTVGSREGWTPRQQQDEGVQQRLEDFMDEQDHNEWGGPLAVHAAFQLNENSKQQPTLALLTGGVVQPANIGRELLRALGWRESSSSAFVPSARSTFNSGNQQEHLYLSARRLRKIQLNQAKVDIPQPKLDTAGLGFKRFANAPEFERDREKRRKLQANRRKVYRVADVVAGGSKDPSTLNATNHDDDDDGGENYVSYETVHDFVGNKSVGGFALHEDEDDAYDDDDDENLPHVEGKVKIDQDHFDTVAYEHQFSSDDEKEVSLPKNSRNSTFTALGSVLSAWASASAPLEGEPKKQILTSDGRPVLPSFRLGGTDSSFSTSQRFPGPDAPAGYEVQPHVFLAEDDPLVIQALSHAEKLTASAEQKKMMVDDALKSNAAANKPSRLHQKGVFEGLRTTMSSRFVTSSVTTETPMVPVAGLSTAAEYERSQAIKHQPAQVNDKLNSSTKLKITWTASSFVPEPLLCKRFHIAAPEHTALTQTNKVEPRTREEVYFQDEILAKAKVAPSNKSSPIAGEDKKRDIDGLSENVRPSMEVYQAIYNAHDSPESTEDENDMDVDATGDTVVTINESETLTVAVRKAESAMDEQIVTYKEQKQSRKHQQTPSSSDGSSSDQKERRRNSKDHKDKKRKKERKERRESDDRKRRKKHKSSKRKRDRGRQDE